MITDITVGQLDEFVKEGVSLVDFYAEWCGPCNRLLKILPKFSEEYEGKVKFLKVDVDKLPPTFIEIRVVPTFHLYVDGKMVEKWEGVKTLLEMKKILDKWV